jgi:hypothetical protein
MMMKFEFLSFNIHSPAPFVYKSCGCLETCSTLEKKEQLIHSSSAVTDPVNLAKLKSICSTALQEGCVCPEGTVLHNGKCLRDTDCKTCDDKVRENTKLLLYHIFW